MEKFVATRVEFGDVVLFDGPLQDFQYHPETPVHGVRIAVLRGQEEIPNVQLTQLVSDGRINGGLFGEGFQTVVPGKAKFP